MSVHGDLAKRGTADQTDDIDPSSCRLGEMAFFLCQSFAHICLFTGIDIPIWTVLQFLTESIGGVQRDETSRVKISFLNEEVDFLLLACVCSTVRIVYM